MRKTGVLSILFVLVLLAVSSMVEAQQPKKVARIGFLTAANLSDIATRTEAFRQGLHELGYVEGKNILIEWRSAEGKFDRLSTLAAELVRLGVAVIVTGGSTATRSAKEATLKTPIIMAQDNDPVANGFILSHAQPGGNITGLSTLAPEISGKGVELLKEIVPSLSRVAVFGQSTNPGNAQALNEIELAARALGLRTQYVDLKMPKDIETAFREASSGRAEAILALGSPVLVSRLTQVADLAAKSRLPVTYTVSDFVNRGGLMAYGVSFTDLHRRAATYVDKILNGANPADLPVEAPTKFELVINLKAAKQIGLTIPPSFLTRADRVIK